MEKELALVHAELTEHIQNMYDASCPLWQACMENQKSAADIDNYRLDLVSLYRNIGTTTAIETTAGNTHPRTHRKHQYFSQASA